eukprot:scaffold11116_cov104-Skeletonema_menzelii.AAC.1
MSIVRVGQCNAMFLFRGLARPPPKNKKESERSSEEINTASYNRDNAKGTFHQAEMVGKAQTNRMSAPGGE